MTPVRLITEGRTRGTAAGENIVESVPVHVPEEYQDLGLPAENAPRNRESRPPLAAECHPGRGYSSVARRSSANASASWAALQWALRPLGLGRIQRLVAAIVRPAGPTLASRSAKAVR
jgi:hypothetical protein